MKKTRKMIIMFALVLAVCCLFAACTENTKQTAIDTNKTYTAVASNGGLAVQYGNYLYFVNGYAGQSALNTFGDVKTGAVCRVELKKNEQGELYYDYKTFTVVVPKNVYGTDTTNGGIYIVNDYIYYHTTSTDKDSKREYKTDEGVLMRSKIDGSSSDVIKNFSDNATSFRVSNNYLTYVRSEDDGNHIHAIKLSDLSDADFESDRVLSYAYSDNYLIYTTYNNSRPTQFSNSDYLVKLFDFKTGNVTLLMSSDIYNGGKDGYLYTTSIKAVQERGDSIYLFYTKSDNSNDKVSCGYYFCYFPKAAPAFSQNAEFRLTYQSSEDAKTYDKFFCLQDGSVLASNEADTSAKKVTIDLYDSNLNRIENEDVVENGAFSTYELTDVTGLIDIYETESEVYAYFTTSSSKSINGKSSFTALNYIKLFNKVDGEYVIAVENVSTFFYFNASADYIPYEVTDLHYYDANGQTDAKAIYFLNSDVGNLAYYYIFQGDNDRTSEDTTGLLLGKVDDEKMLELISSGAIEEDE